MSFNTVTYNGLILGDEEWVITSVEGLGAVDIASEIVKKPGADGAFVYAKLLTERHVLIEGVRFSTPEAIWGDMQEVFENAFAPQDDDLPAVFQVLGRPPQTIDCRPINRHYDIFDSEGVAEYLVELVASNPVIT